MENLLSFEIVDLSELTEISVSALEHDGCGISSGHCSTGCGCGRRNGWCGAADETIN